MLLFATLAAQPNHNGGGRPAGGGAPARAPVHYTHPAAPNQVQVQYHPIPRAAAPDQFHPAATRPVQVSRPQITRNVTVRNTQVYRDITNYHINRYHTTVNVAFAAHPGSDHGYWANGWYHGYWYDYWANQNWTSWGGHTGFWLSLDGLNVFVYEYSPGVCWYWNGYQWVPWYNPPYTPYYCPY
jgi:hypothetical protein